MSSSSSSSSSSWERPIYWRSNDGWSDTDGWSYTDSDGDRVLRDPVDISTLSTAADFCRHRYNYDLNAPPHDRDGLNSNFMATSVRTHDFLEKLMHAAKALHNQSLLDLARARMEELNAQVQNAGYLEIDQDVEIRTRTLRDLILAIFVEDRSNIMWTPPPSPPLERPIYARSNDGWNVNVDEAFVAGSEFVRFNLLNNTNIDTDSDGDRVLRVPVDFSILSTAADFCRNRYNYDLKGPFHDRNALNALDSNFMATSVPTHHSLERLMHGAETLQIQSLLDLTRARIEELAQVQNAQVQNAQVQNAQVQNAGYLEIDQDVEIITHTLRDSIQVQNAQVQNAGYLEIDQDVEITTHTLRDSIQVQNAQVQNAGYLEIDQDVEIITHTLRDSIQVQNAQVQNAGYLEIDQDVEITTHTLRDSIQVQNAQVQNAGYLEIDQDVEIITHTLRDSILSILAISIILIFLILATGGIVYLAIHNRK